MACRATERLTPSALPILHLQINFLNISKRLTRFLAESREVSQGGIAVDPGARKRRGDGSQGRAIRSRGNATGALAKSAEPLPSSTP